MSIIPVKIPKTLKERRAKSTRLQMLAPNHSTCKCCYIPWKFVSGKSIKYSTNSGHFPLCYQCYYSDEVPFEDVINYYTNRGTWEHENFTESEVDYIIDQLINELKKDPKLKQKYNQFIADKRGELINSLLDVK